MTNTIAVFQISTEEDLRFQLDFVGLDLAGRLLKVNVRERDSGLLKVSLEAPANLMLVGGGNLTAFYAKGLMAAWARTEYEADVIDETGGTFTRIMAVRFVYDEPGKLVYGVKGNQATVKWGGNQAVVTAIGGVGPPGPANSLEIGDVETLEAGEPATASITGAAPNQELNLGLPKGDKGDKGWAPVFGLVADGERFVFVLAGWSGGEGPPPPITSGGLPVYVGPAGFTTTIGDAFDTRGETGLKGDRGDKGWAPLLVAVPDGARRVLRVADWLGGEGGKPPVGAYLGDGALVTDIADAVDFRGPPGSVVAPGSIDTADLADGILSADTEGRGKMADGFLTTDKVEDKAITPEKQADVASGVFIGRASAGAGSQEPLSPAQARTLAQVDRFNRPRNRIINGAMWISQRYGGNTIDISSGGYSLDHWNIIANGGGTVRTQMIGAKTPGGSPNRMRITAQVADASIAAGDIYTINQQIEGYQFPDASFGRAGAKPLVVRFGVKSSIAGTFSVAIRGATASRSWLGSFTIAAGEVNTDVLRTFIVPGDTTGAWLDGINIGAELFVSLGVGATFQGVAGWNAGNFISLAGTTNFMATAGNTLELFDVGLYVDHDATGIVPPWTLPVYDDDLRGCMRYYQNIRAIHDFYTPGSSIVDRRNWYLPVVMRTTPSIVSISNINVANVTFNAVGGSPSDFTHDVTSGTGGYVAASRAYGLSAEFY